MINIHQIMHKATVNLHPFYQLLPNSFCQMLFQSFPQMRLNFSSLMSAFYHLTDAWTSEGGTIWSTACVTSFWQTSFFSIATHFIKFASATNINFYVTPKPLILSSIFWQILCECNILHLKTWYCACFQSAADSHFWASPLLFPDLSRPSLIDFLSFFADNFH